MQLGVCYHPEQWPESRWESDARAMAAAGIGQVRVGEFCWARMEPRHGHLEWVWLDRAIDTLHAAGLRVVMSTPTAAPPKWLVDRYPGMLAVGADGRPRAFGVRRCCDFSSDIYFEQARRITTRVAQRYGRHPAIVAWQVDNEYGHHTLSYSTAAVARFRLWLRDRYESIQRLNECWTNVIWGMEYSGFDEIDAPTGAVLDTNPAHLLDYRRFASDEVVRFNRMQCDLLRAHSPGRPLTHNFLPFSSGFDHYKLGADLDVAAWDSWPLGMLEDSWLTESDKNLRIRTGHPDFTAFHHDLYRGVGHGRLWVMEQQVGAAHCAKWNAAPAPGMVRLWAWEAFGHGAEVVSCSRWRQDCIAQDRPMDAGLQFGGNPPEVAPDVGFAELMQVAAELDAVRAASSSSPRAAGVVALVFDYDSCWTMQAQLHGGDIGYVEQAFEAYSALRSLALDVDVVSSHDDLSGYALVVIPSLPAVPGQLVTQLKQGRAQVLLYPRFGSRASTLNQTSPPTALQELISLRVNQVESLRPGVSEPVRFAQHEHVCVHWREHLQLGTDVQGQAWFSDGGAAVARQGRVRYLAGRFDAGLTRAIMAGAAAEAGIPTRLLPAGLRLSRIGELIFALNYDDVAHDAAIGPARWLIGQARVPPRGVSVAHVPDAIRGA